MSPFDKAKNMQDDLKDSAHKIWLAGLGAMTMAGEEGSKLLKSLIEKGEEFEGRARGSVDAVTRPFEGAKDKAGDFFGRMENMVNDRVVAALQKFGVPTRDEINELTNRVDKLMDAISKLNDAQAEAAKDEK